MSDIQETLNELALKYPEEFHKAVCMLDELIPPMNKILLPKYRPNSLEINTFTGYPVSPAKHTYRTIYPLDMLDGSRREYITPNRFMTYKVHL